MQIVFHLVLHDIYQKSMNMIIPKTAGSDENIVSWQIIKIIILEKYNNLSTTFERNIQRLHSFHEGTRF